MNDPSPNAETVLIVDDEESVLSVVKRFMERGGFRVHTASNGLDALKTVEETDGKIHAVLLDMTMPGMDGEAVYRELARIRPGITVLLASGFTGDEITSRFAPGEIAGFIQKPYRLDKLVAQIREAIQSAS